MSQGLKSPNNGRRWRRGWPPSSEYWKQNTVNASWSTVSVRSCYRRWCLLQKCGSEKSRRVLCGGRNGEREWTGSGPILIVGNDFLPSNRSVRTYFDRSQILNTVHHNRIACVSNVWRHGAQHVTSNKLQGWNVYGDCARRRQEDLFICSPLLVRMLASGHVRHK